MHILTHRNTGNPLIYNSEAIYRNGLVVPVILEPTKRAKNIKQNFSPPVNYNVDVVRFTTDQS